MTLHLSRLRLNERHRQAANDRRSAYSLHQSLRWAFPHAGEAGGPLPGGERILWRDDGPGGILVQSVTRPDWAALEERWPGYFQDAQLKAFDLAGVREGQTFRFRLRANVTVNRWRDGQDRQAGERTRREALRGAREQLDWLDRQGERGGFRVLGADIAHSGNARLYKAPGGRPITLFAVTFEGLLATTDPARLEGAVRGGIGKAKALGFGLLSLARA